MLRLRTLGSVTLDRSGQSGSSKVELQPKRLALLVYLAAARPREAHRRDTLLALFWPELDQTRARKALRNALYYLREELGREAVRSRGERVVVDPDHLWCDATAFASALESGEPEAALELYRGEFLEGFHVSEAPEFERWLVDERSHLQRRAMDAARELSKEAEGAGNLVGAVSWARRAVRLDPTDEQSLRRLLRLLATAGDRSAAVRAYESFRDRLKTDWELEPSSATRELVEEIRALQDTRSEAAPETELGPPPGDTPDHDRGERERSRVEDRTSERSSALGSFPRWFATHRKAAGFVLLLLVAAIVYGLLPLGEASPPAGGGGDPPPTAVDRSVAVLPFQKLSAGEGDEYFVRGMHQAVLTTLTNVRELVVTSAASVARYEDSSRSLEEIARELGVRYVLTGSLQRAGDRVQVTAQLVDSRQNRYRWAKKFDRAYTAEALFDIQSEVAREVAGALQARLTPEEMERIDRRPTGSLTAYDFYLRGRERLGPRIDQFVADQRSVEQAMGLFRQALKLDPRFALAHAGLAETYAALVDLGVSGAWMDSLHAAAERALQIDPELPEGHLLLAEYHAKRHAPVPRLRELRSVLELRPGDARATTEIAKWYTVSDSRLDQSVCWMARAVELDPKESEYRRGLGRTYAQLGDFARAENAIRGALELEPDNLRAYRWLVTVDLARGDRPAAIRHYRTARTVASDAFPDMVMLGMMESMLGLADSARAHLGSLEGSEVHSGVLFAHVLWRTGERRRARELLEWREDYEQRALTEGKAGYWPPLNLAKIHAIRGEVDEAVSYLEQAEALGWRLNVLILPQIDTPFRNLWSDPSFGRVVDPVQAQIDSMRQRVEREGCDQIRELPDLPGEGRT